MCFFTFNTINNKRQIKYFRWHYYLNSILINYLFMAFLISPITAIRTSPPARLTMISERSKPNIPRT